MLYRRERLETLFSFFAQVQIEETADVYRVNLSPFRNLLWKTQGIQQAWKEFSINAQGDFLSFSKSLSDKEFFAGVHHLEKVLDVLARENLHCLDFWGEYSSVLLQPRGFGLEGAPSSQDILAQIQDTQLVVKEKKPFVIDLERSQGAFFVSSQKDENLEPSVILDAAAQISSLALGYNHSEKNAMTLKPELWNSDWSGEVLRKWDVCQALLHVLKKESSYPFIELAGSGSEAWELALKYCLSQHPERRKILAFEGSFHGRSVLALHTTYNLDKRLPFELSREYVDFVPFPEIDDYYAADLTTEPFGWLQVWAHPETHSKKIVEWEESGSSLLAKEIFCLKSVLERIQEEETLNSRKPLCLVVEPLQCEGGDRYASPRFLRALRILCRQKEVPFVIDEVQSFGLSEKLFWFKSISFQNIKGEEDPPDAVYLAKRAQVGACLTSQPQEKSSFEVSAANIYRGYLQIQALLNCDVLGIEARVKRHLLLIQEVLGKEIFQNPRNRGLAFTFDLPRAEALNALIEARFKMGTIFYPAGTRTARFRLMTDLSERDLVYVFDCVFRCFLDVGEKKLLGNQFSADRNVWIQKLSSSEQKYLVEELSNASVKKSCFSSLPYIKSASDLERITVEEARQIFLTLMDQTPWLMWEASSLLFGLEELVHLKAAQLWDQYLGDRHWTQLDLLWTWSRARSFNVKRVRDTQEQKKYAQKIDQLEERVYEPARRDPSDKFLKLGKELESIFLVVDHPLASEELAALSLACPLSKHPPISLLTEDLSRTDPMALYSVDLTVHPDFQGQGLGLRLKVEQLLEARRQGSSVIRSRNRWPEARAMMKLNQKLGAVIIDRNDKDYGGQAVAVYQSISIPERSFQRVFSVGNPGLGALKNKCSLVNFVSRSYVSNVCALAERVPKKLRHFFMASSRAEALDKAIKLFRYKRVKANRVLSFRGDFFPVSTAATRAMGEGPVMPSQYFQWPHLDWPAEKIFTPKIKEQLEHLASKESILCLMLSLQGTSQKKTPEQLKTIIQEYAAYNIPVCIHTDPQGLKNIQDLEMAALVFHGQGQIAFVAVNEEYNLPKPLMMISTWDGDEHSFNLFMKEWEQNA